MSNRECRKCGKVVPFRAEIEGKFRNLKNRKYCLECSPFGLHNTKQIEKIEKINDGLKKCSKCNQEKDISEFPYKKTENRFMACCKKCLYKSQIERWKKRKIKAVEYKGGKCLRCGYNKSYNALVFHHRDREEKEYDWYKLRLRSWPDILKEIDKCDLLCSNCHAEEHEL